MGNVISIHKPKKYGDVKHDPVLAENLKDLRSYVENQGTGKLRLIKGVYQTPSIETVQTTKYGVYEFGYQVKPTIDPGFFVRNIYIKFAGHDISEVPQAELEPIMGAIFVSLIDKGCEFPKIETIAVDCILIQQIFSVIFWKEGNPGIVTPGKSCIERKGR